MFKGSFRFRALAALAVVAAGLASTNVVRAQEEKPEYPPHAEVLKDFEKVVSTVDDKPSMYTLWTREKDGQMFAELPKNFGSQKYFIALTVSSGERFAGLQAGDMYVYWRQYDKRLALISPNTNIRSTGDNESKASVERLFTDQVLLEVPIVTMGPGGGPVVDMDQLLVMQAPVFFGQSVFNKSLTPRLYKITKAKAFPENVELAFEIPNAAGRLQSIHYSISVIPDKSDYKPREADERLGYFITTYDDLGKYKDDEVIVRYINRWNLQKADPKLKLSPPKKPIVFYIEHTTPIRYRRWVREGILAWNKAFEKVGLANAIEVHYQDAATGAHMEKDPEDVRYNFVRWLNNDQGTAIGPSRVHPLTGEIMDADIILTDGWIRHYRLEFEDLLPKYAMEGFSPETLAWLATHPDWDPRVRLAAPSQREYIRARLAAQAPQAYGGHPLAHTDSKLMGDDEYDGLVGRSSQVNGSCLAAEGKAFDMALMAMTFSMMNDLRELAAEEDDDGDKEGEDDKEGDDKEEEKDEEKSPEDELIDGMPESFVGPLLANLVAHEVGHTLGLRHNFKGSAVYTLDEINSDEMAGKTSHATSVMDYSPVNIRMEAGNKQGDYTMLGIGPYDMWAIEYGYTLESDLKPILSRVAQPELQYATDEDTYGPDPLARRYDFSAEPLDYANDQMKLAKFHRERIIDKFVKEGDSWSRARRGYGLTLSLQMRAVSMMANWIGGVHVYRDKKGDPDGRPPLEVVPAERQREALKFVINTTFHDDAYGLTPELLQRLANDRWLDGSRSLSEAAWPIHDSIMGFQASALTMLMNPTTLSRVYDNEFRVPADQDALTLPELLETLRR
ncbi:MAG: zinc-dependent metalloprotease, partial [Planctomycetes bacterium]|nr:zinc-dependent metalloprotease [Planctomycetota bacterium]